MGECEDGEGMVFVCHWGLERSRAAAEAMRNQGFLASHIEGGTRAIAKMTDDQIRQKFKDCPEVLVIYDRGSKDDEYENKEVAVSKLRKLGYHVDQMDTMQLSILLYENGEDINNYLR